MRYPGGKGQAGIYQRLISLMPPHDVYIEPFVGGGSWAIETLWFNFDPPAQLHDFRYIGEDFRERERIKRKRARWRLRFAALPGLEREAMLQVLLELASPGAAVRSSSSEMALPDPAPGLTMGPALDPLAIPGDAISRSAGIAAAGEGCRHASPFPALVDVMAGEGAR